MTVELKASKRNLVTSEKKLRTMSDELEAQRANVGKYESRVEAIAEERDETTSVCERLSSECEECEAELKEANKAVKQAEAQIQKLEAERIDLKHKLDAAKEKLKEAEHHVKAYESKLKALKLHNIRELERLGRSDVSINETGVSEHGGGGGGADALPKLDHDDLTGLDEDELKKSIHRLEEKMAAQSPNLAAIQHYKELEMKFMERVAELEQITNERDVLCAKYEDIRKRRFDEFMQGFTEIRLKLKEIYRTVTIEGDAELELVDSMDPFTEGIVLSVRPPKKSWKNVSNLSGGEKTLSSLSLVFALHEFRATPIYVMDEIDAALDFKNVSIIAHYIKVNIFFILIYFSFGFIFYLILFKERTKNAQFIIISLRNNMFELCNRLFGIYKVRNCTSAAFIAPELIELEEKRHPDVKKELSRAVSATASSSTALANRDAGPANGNPEDDGDEQQKADGETAAATFRSSNLNSSNVQAVNV